MPRRSRYNRLFPFRKPDCWIRFYPEMIVLEVSLFQETFYKSLTIETKAVFIGLLMLYYEKGQLAYDPYDLADTLSVNPADLQNSVQELEQVCDPIYHRPLVAFLRDEHNLLHLYIPIVDHRVRPMNTRAIDLYRQAGEFSRLTREEKEERLRRDVAA